MSGSEVAESLSISQPTFSAHLRAAERRLLGMVVGDDRLEADSEPCVSIDTNIRASTVIPADDYVRSMGLGRVVTTASLGTTASVSAVVVEAVAKARDVDPIRLPPLYDWIDPDALDALFGAGGAADGRREGDSSSTSTASPSRSRWSATPSR
ncbi:HalOD1 output domain-containing protein [Halobaculum litoreum]|uniref:HalOD1 output domain-containing protein n=1 Tax=Halobaculum litoreum TaxID=3031998 RepID=A0ABD5XWB7_9EURY